MVSEMDGWNPLHSSTASLELNEHCLTGSTAICEKTHFYIHLRIITVFSIHFHELRSSSSVSSPFLLARQSSTPVVDTALSLTSLCIVVLILVNSIYISCFLKSLLEVDHSFQVFFRRLKGKNQMKNRNKQMKGDRMGEGTDEGDGSKTTRISLSFPISAGLPGFSAQKHCPLIHPPSSSAGYEEDASDGTAWKKETVRDKHLSKVSKSDCLPCSSTSTIPIDLTAPVSKNCKPSLSFSVAGSDPHFPTSALHTSTKMDYSRETSGAGLPNDYPEHSTTETAHILFNLSARAFQGQLTKDPESSKGKKRKGNSLHVELSLPLPSINPPSSSSSPPPISPSSVSPMTLPPPSFHDPYRTAPKPELLCGVCHRLFSTASSLTVHMRLHRGGRVLSCRHCGKAFIHNKRLQSHEATCRQALPAFPIQPKQEPLEEGEVEKKGEDAQSEQHGQETGPGRPIKKGRGLHGHHAGEILHSDGMKDEDHFVKVVDGHIIYFCSVCERSYMTLSSLKRHSNVHSWRRKYPCHYCDKVFALAEYRTKHEVWHTGERRYQCIFCWEAFPTYYNLKTHQKAFHGISPGLISSEKTANGGYKQKVNALKLYRLLPMRSQKRPYKTYSHALADGLLKPDSSVNLPLDCSLPPNMDARELESFLKDLQSENIKPDPDRCLVKTDTEQCKTLSPTSQTDMPAEVSEQESSDERMSGNTSGKAKTFKSSEAAVSSVITFGHSKPSVIMHSTALPSSVIVQRNKVSSENEKTPSEIKPVTAKVSQKQIKKHSQKEHTHAHSRWNEDTANTEGSKIQLPIETLHKGRKSHSKSELSKTVPISVDSEVKGSGPLCQITVRIGEEAIVKRSISETDLMRDKSPSLSKAKKSNLPHEEQREQRHTHHHHRKHHGHHRSNQKGKEGEPKWKNPRLPSKVRKYFFRQEVREDRNDHDGEDNLWRPYYSYKPKRKALHMQKTKNWQRKMHYKRSLRLMRRAERLMNHVNKEVDGQEKEKEQAEEEEKEIHDKEQPDNTPLLPGPSTTEQKEEERGTPERVESPISGGLSQSTLDTQYTASSNIKQRWSGDQAAECGSCGRWFSSPRKRDKHELTHLFEFVCLLCRAPFPSQTKLEEHQRTNHPKTKPSSTSAPSNSQLSSKETVVELGEGCDVMSRRFLEKGSPVRLGKRLLARYTCSQCDKVCKTAAALNCHLKRHELGSPTENVQQVQDEQSQNSLTPETNKDQNKDLDITSEHARPVPVINYSKIDPQQTEDQVGEGSMGFPKEAASDRAKLATFDKIHSPQACTTSSTVSPTLERSKVLSPSLPSVLVMNGAECLDYRTPEKRSLDAHEQRGSLTPTDKPSQVCQIQTVPKLRTVTDPPISMALQSVRCSALEQGVVPETQRHGDIYTHDQLNDLQEAQDLRVFATSRAACNSQAEDLSMQTILARERELAQQTAHQSTTNTRRFIDEEVKLIVPKEEPLSPVPSPTSTCSVIQTTQKGPPQRHSQSPCHTPSPLNLQLRPHLEPNQLHQGMHHAEKQRSVLQTSSGRGGERPPSRAMLHPQVPHSEQETKDSTSSALRDPHRESEYPVQEFALPLIIPGGYCSGKKQEEQILMSYPPGPLSFGPLGKMVPHTDSSKLPFYPDPYHLLYGPQLLPYPYSLAALPMALNMMTSGDKVEPLPFFPTLFNYTAAGAPFTGTVPHPLMVNPSLYNNSSSSSTKQDSGNP